MSTTQNESMTLPIEEQQRIVEAGADLWSALSAHGFVDGFGGMEFRRVFPLAVEFIIAQSNMAGDGTTPPARGLFTLGSDGDLIGEVLS